MAGPIGFLFRVQSASLRESWICCQCDSPSPPTSQGDRENPAPRLHYSNGRAALGDQRALNRRSSIQYTRLPSFRGCHRRVRSSSLSYIRPARDRTERRSTARLFGNAPRIFDCGLEDFPERAGASALNAACYPLSSGTDPVNCGRSISFLTLAMVSAQFPPEFSLSSSSQILTSIGR
jgi:hypothetical protein